MIYVLYVLYMHFLLYDYVRSSNSSTRTIAVLLWITLGKAVLRLNLDVYSLNLSDIRPKQLHSTKLNKFPNISYSKHFLNIKKVPHKKQNARTNDVNLRHFFTLYKGRYMDITLSILRRTTRHSKHVYMRSKGAFSVSHNWNDTAASEQQL